MKMREALTRAASLAPTSWNAEARTIDVTFSTGADVTRYDAKGPYVERLDMRGVDLGRFVGASVLNAHAQRGLGDVLGVVLKATKAGVATLQMSARDDVAPFIKDIAAGVIRHLSIGYRVQEWRESIDPKSGARIKTAARWQPHEISFVPVPADFGATTRSQTMDPELENAPESPATETPAVNEAAQRNAAIRSLCRANAMTREFEDSLIDGEGDLIAARAAVNAEIQRRAVTVSTRIGVSHEDPGVILQRQIEGLHARVAGGQPGDAARQYAGLGLSEHADLILARNGISVAGLSREQRLERAAHGTSDFPELLTGVGRRTLLASYQAAASAMKTIARQTTAVDFRTKSALAISGAGMLEEISEHGEIKHTTRSETKESYALRTFARGWAISRKAIINDDLGAFNDSARVFGQAAAQTEAAELVALLEGNPQMEDGENLFSAAHNNNRADNAPFGSIANDESVAAISAARLAMRKMTDADGTLISVGPKYLVVSAELETAAEQFVASYNASYFTETNPFAKLVPLVEPRLAPWTYYLFADPSQAPVLEYAHLASAQGPIIESRPAWTTLGMEVRAYLDFGCGAVGWKGAFRFEDGQPTGDSE